MEKTWDDVAQLRLAIEEAGSKLFEIHTEALRTRGWFSTRPEVTDMLKEYALATFQSATRLGRLASAHLDYRDDLSKPERERLQVNYARMLYGMKLVQTQLFPNRQWRDLEAREEPVQQHERELQATTMPHVAV